MRRKLKPEKAVHVAGRRSFFAATARCTGILIALFLLVSSVVHVPLPPGPDSVEHVSLQSDYLPSGHQRLAVVQPVRQDAKDDGPTGALPSVPAQPNSPTHIALRLPSCFFDTPPNRFPLGWRARAPPLFSTQIDT